MTRLMLSRSLIAIRIFARNGYTLTIQKGLEESGDMSAMAGLVNLQNGMCIDYFYYNKNSDEAMFNALDRIISDIKKGKQDHHVLLTKALIEAKIKVDGKILEDEITRPLPKLDKERF